jgi:hypothetical protein
MARFLEAFPDAPVALVLEDDVSFEFAHLWPAPIAALLADATAATPDWRVVQLGAIVCDRDDLLHPDRALSIIKHDRAVPRSKTNWFSTVAYAVRREYAQEVVDAYTRTEGDPDDPDGPNALVVDLETLAHHGCVSVHPEPFVYAPGPPTVLFLPLFGFVGSDSDIKAAENPRNHSVARGYLQAFWGNK